MVKEKIDELISLSEDKYELLEGFWDATKKQNKMIEDEEMDSFDGALEERSKIMKDIDRIDGRFISIFEEIKKEENIESIEEIPVDSYGNLKDLKEVISKISTILRNISQLDSKNRALMQKNLDGVKYELRNLKDTQTAYKGYHHEESGSMMIDERK